MDSQDVSYLAQLQVSPVAVLKSNLGTPDAGADEAKTVFDVEQHPATEESVISLCSLATRLSNEKSVVSGISVEKDTKSDDLERDKFLPQLFRLMKFLSEFTALPAGELFAFCNLEYKKGKLDNIRKLLISRGFLTDELMTWMCDHQANQLSHIIVRLIEAENFQLTRIFCYAYDNLLADLSVIGDYARLTRAIGDENLARKAIDDKIQNPFDVLILLFEQLLTRNIYPGCPELEAQSSQLPVDVPDDVLRAAHYYAVWLVCQLYGEPEFQSAVGFVRAQICFGLLKLIDGGIISMHIERREDIIGMLKLIENDALASAAYILQKISATKTLLKQGSYC